MTKARIKECLGYLREEMRSNPVKFGDDFKNLQLYVNQKEKEEKEREIAEEQMRDMNPDLLEQFRVAREKETKELEKIAEKHNIKLDRHRALNFQ